MPEDPSLAERLGSADAQVQRSACDEATRQLADDPDSLRGLLDLLRDGSSRARFAATFVLFHSRHRSLRLLSPLLDGLELEAGDLRWSAANMLAVLGREHAEVLPVVVHAARESESPLQRRMAIYALRELAPERPEAREVLASKLDDSDLAVRRAALSSMAKLVEPDRRCITRAIEILDADPDPAMRRIAATVLPDLISKVPGFAEDARGALAAAARTLDPALRRAVEGATARIGSPS